MNLKLKVWRQKNSKTPGRFVEYPAQNIIPDIIPEMLTRTKTIGRGEEPIAFDFCREGSGDMFSRHWRAPTAHKGTTVCQLHMRHFKDGTTS
jgi:succinate dehydrogenase / fumarate reductase iron-sulfur subunit